jgi:hypothetical protein
VASVRFARLHLFKILSLLRRVTLSGVPLCKSNSCFYTGDTGNIEHSETSVEMKSWGEDADKTMS